MEASPPIAPLPGLRGDLTPEALGQLFDAFSSTSREMQLSHERLQARVALLGRRLAEKDRELQEKKRLEALGLMVAGVAHEFRNPLGSVSLYLDGLATLAKGLEGKARREAGEVLAKVELAVRHLNSIVEDMLLLTRGAEGAAEPCDLPRLLDEALLLVRGDVEAAGAVCRVEAERGGAPGSLTVPGDPDHMVRILVNILKNALQAVAASRASGEGRVEVRLARREGGRGRGAGAVEVTVTDNGPGIATEKLERLFVPFHTDKPKGVGLGLYLVRSLLERQGGRIEVENGEAGGLRVRLFFAARRRRAGAAGTAGTIAGSRAGTGTGTGERSGKLAGESSEAPAGGRLRGRQAGFEDLVPGRSGTFETGGGPA